MATSFASLGLSHLSHWEKIALVDDLAEELELAASPPALSLAQREELKRRIADIEANPDSWIPLNEVHAEIERRFVRVDRLTESQREELYRRAVLSEADPDGGRTWEEIYAETLARLEGSVPTPVPFTIPATASD